MTTEKLRRRFTMVTIAASVVVIALAGAAPGSAFTNGQGADLVLGQSDFVSNGAAATGVGMSGPHGVAVDPTTGKVFVGDSDNHRVLRFADLATLSDGQAAEGVLGQLDFFSNLANRGGAAATNTLSAPYGVFVDTTGTLWVADAGNHRVLRFDGPPPWRTAPTRTPCSVRWTSPARPSASRPTGCTPPSGCSWTRPPGCGSPSTAAIG